MNPQRATRPADGRDRLVEPVDVQLGRRDPDPLLVAAGQGDLDAFAAFYDRTAGVVFGLLRRALGVRAEFATTQVYLQVWRAAPGFDSTGPSANAVLLRTTQQVIAGLRGDTAPQQEECG